MFSTENLSISLEEPTDRCKDDIANLFNNFLSSNHVSPLFISETGILLFHCLRKVKEFLIDDKYEDFITFILKWHGSLKKKLICLCDEGNEQQVQSSFKTILYLLQAEIVLDSRRMIFPIHQYAELIKIMISVGDITFFLRDFKDILVNEDMSRNIWKALSIAICELSDNLSAKEVMNIIHIINCVEKPKSQHALEMGPSPSYCQLSEGIINDKEIEVCIKKFWNKISGTKELSLKEKQMLLLVLYEQLMPRMMKPIFLIDFFMTSLNAGGPVGLLALQGIFTLIQKYNMNYPDVYTKIYSMLDYYIFDSQYKSRFYYLTDMFLSSLHLPEALVAGFIKKFARLSLTAPPVDVIIMMTFIVNLIIRHPGLRKLMHKVDVICVKTDPYNTEESDPALSSGIDSSLWEVKIIQYHVLPSVSASAMFIDNPLPAVERDLSVLLDLRNDEVFGKEFKKKVKNPPISFEKPTSLTSPASKNGTNLWCLIK